MVISRQLADVLSQLYKLVMLSDYATDNSPLLSTSNGTVSEACSATYNTVVADDVLFRFDNNRAFVPDERLLKYFEDLLIQYRGLDTADLPLMLSDEQWCHRVLDTHDQIEELFKALK